MPKLRGTAESGSREWPVDLGPITPTGDVDRWALLVGVSEYAHDDLNLRFAARDAWRLRETLLEPTAGAFPDDHVLTLVDGDATLANLTKALRTFLKKPAPEDLVVLFVACHGSRDRDRPDNLYLFPHDIDPSDISGTGLPMREVELALRETLLSRRVVVLVDACHSGGLAGAFADIRAAGDDADDLNRYLTELSTSRGGVSLMTSAMAMESSIEGEEWGKGHGVFTHFLLEGLRGRADRPPYDGLVTVGELFDFVEDRVKEATEGRQHPHISADSDRGLVLAVTGSLSAGQHLDLAQHLAETAALLGEPTSWRGAAVQYGEAIRLRPDRGRAAFGVHHALALYRSGDAAAAERGLHGLPSGTPGARLTLGLVQLAEGRPDEAASTLLVPDPVEPWAEALFSAALPRGPRVALLVALDVVDPDAYGGWEGKLMSPVAEVDALAEVLETSFGFDEQVRLVDSQATALSIRSALEEVVDRSASCEAVVVCLSGHGAQVPVSGEPAGGFDSTFVAFDAQITSAEIDTILRRSAAGRTTLIVSAAHSGRFAERGAAGGYEVITSCAEDQFDMDGQRLSVFFEALLPNLQPELPGDAVAHATGAATKAQTQTPQFAVDGSLPLFAAQDGRGGWASGGAGLARVLLGVTASESTPTLDEVAELAAGGGLPETTASTVAVELWRRGALDRLAAMPVASPPASLAEACAAAVGAARGSTAVTMADTLEHLADVPVVAADAALLADIRALVRLVRRRPRTESRLHAVLVGLSSLADGSAGIKSAPDSVEGVRATLIAAGAKHVKALVDGKATLTAVEAALMAAGGVDDHPVLVYWCGPGSLAAMECFDGRRIAAATVAELTGSRTTLVAEGIEPGPPAGSSNAPSVLPRLTVLSASGGRKGPSLGVAWHPRLDGSPGKARYGRLTVALVEALRSTPLGTIPASALAGPGEGPTVVSASETDLLLADPVATRVDALVRRVRDAELTATADLVTRLLEQRNGIDAEAQLQLGILRAELGDADAAVTALEHAVQQFGADARGEARARLHLARVLLDSGRDRAGAVSECRRATERDPELAAAWFWLGRAIAELVERETAAEASVALRTYLARGAPIGRRSEVRELLSAMAGKAAPPRRA